MLKNPWLKIILAIGFEDGWVVGIKHAHTPLMWVATLIALGLSMLLFLKASEQLPVGTAYAVFVGLGTVATVVTGWVAFGDGMTIAELVFLVILLGGIIGLKLLAEEKA